MAYDFRALSPTDFEDLVGSLLNEELNLRMENFGRGPDQGIDLRFALAKKGKGIVQAKHLVDSGFSALLQTLKKERPKIDALAPKRYILATSVPMTPARKDKIIEALAPHLTDPADIFGQEDLNALLAKHGDVERRFYKLWITSTNVLEKVLHNATFVSSADEAERIERVVKIYVDTGALQAALDLLQAKRLLIISGAPGVGKSTLARILTWHFISADWELISVDSFDAALSVFDKYKKQVFFFDDFMGQIRLSPTKIDQTDEKLLRFIDRVQRAEHSIFILTSREYILRQAQFESEKIASPKVDLRTYTINIEAYHRAARAKILYNHVYYSEAGKEYKSKIIEDLFYMKMINHDNFSPRLIEALTSPEVIESIPVSEYRKWIIDNLDHPIMLWKTPFEAHLSRAGRNLIIAMFFEEDGVEIERLKFAFGRVHARISKRHNVATDAIDFARAIKETEGTFLNISNGRASFPNPSLRDFLDQTLSGSSEVLDVLSVATTSKGLERVIDHILAREDEYAPLKQELVDASRMAALELENTPISREVRHDKFVHVLPEGLSIPRRTSLLLNLWDLVQDDKLAEITSRVACQVGQEPSHRNTFAEKMAPLNLLKDSQFSDFPAREMIEHAVRENAFVAPYVDGHRPSMRDMAAMKRHLERSPDTDADTHLSRLSKAAQEAVDEFMDEVSECTTTDEVQSLRTYLEELAELVEADTGWLEEMLDEREAELEESERDDSDWEGPSGSRPVGPSTDDAIISLFSTLQ